MPLVNSARLRTTATRAGTIGLVLIALVALTLWQPRALAQSANAGPAIRQVVGNDLTYVLRDDGTVVSWGRETPAPNPGAPAVVDLPARVRLMAAGADMVYALLEDGRLFAWGANDRGQFGQGPGSSRTPMNPLRSERPVPVVAPNDIVQIAAAGHHALAVRKDGSVLQWGDHPTPAPGDNPTVMKPVAGLADVVKVAAAGDHDLALARDGRVFAWGQNKNGQLGLPLETRRSASPVAVAGLDRVVDIGAAGTTNFGFSGAVRADGSVWMWGSDQSATMGDGTFWGNNGPSPEDHDVPVIVKGVTGAKAMAIGDGHVLVLMQDGTLRTWGHDGWGQAGVGTSGFYQPLPKKPAFTNVAAVYAVGSTSYAVKTDGTLWWWGVALVNNLRSPFGKNQKVPVQLVLP